jgi:LuxR family maltose regulon positive regulatory protein
LRDFTYNAGLYYEMHDQIVPVLRLFECCSKTDRIRSLLIIRNARRNPGNGHYFELRRYYLNLKESNTEDAPILMAGMSMLYSLLMQPEESEAWYDKLKAFSQSTNGALRREAVSRLAYLDIALPHRGSADVLDVMKKISALLDKGIKLPEFSVTSNLPSTMNGGKDFCHWSKHDRQIAATVGPLVAQVLGRYGKGIVKAALGESLYEKGGEMGEILPLLTQVQIESESGGVPEITFAAVGIRVRLTLVCGNLPAARIVLDAFEQRVKEQGAVQLLPNIAALRCRLSLYEGNQEAICRWLETAPSEDTEFFILERKIVNESAKNIISFAL